MSTATATPTPTPTPSLERGKEMAWSALLVRAIDVPGELDQAYSAFHPYSVANQMYALQQCRQRHLEPGPLATFRVWQERGRFVQAGERAISLWMPKTLTVYRDKNSGARLTPEAAKTQGTAAVDRDTVVRGFHIANKWFTISQTAGGDWVDAAPARGWHGELALARQGITERPFTSLSGATRGSATWGSAGEPSITINPAVDHAVRARIHQAALVMLNREAAPGTSIVDDRSAVGPAAVLEAQAAAATLIVAEVNGIDGQALSRAHIQDALHRSGATEFTDPQARSVFAVADRLIKDGRKA